MVIGIKRLGRQRARLVTNVFGKNLAYVDINELTKIDGIGPKTAEKIIEFYEHNKEIM